MPDYPEFKLLIDGEWRTTAETIPVTNPSDETIIGKMPVARKNELDDALTAAANGLRIWSKTAPRQRCNIIMRAAQIMRDNIEDIAYSNTLELGKPINQSRLEVIRASETLEWDANEAQRLYGRVIPSASGIRQTVLRQPIGIVAAFSAWNFPINQPARKIAAALASGCSIILKPAGDTPAGAFHIARAFQAAGLPNGVLNLVFGDPDEISRHLIADERTRLMAFTGSTSVGKHLGKLAAEHMKPVLMELGGHSPVIVCDDVDPVQVATLGAVRKYRNSGQVCTSPTRFYVHEDRYNAFSETFIARAGATIVGDVMLDKTEMGPVANRRRLEAMAMMVEDAVAKGAELKTGGKRLGKKGFFFEPTVLANVPDDALVMNEEPFGPIAILNPVKDLDEAISQANKLPFGLAAYGFTHSAAKTEQMVEEVEAGQLSINTLDTSLPETPFGGVKSSGFGREGGEEGLHNYTVVKNVSQRVIIG